MLNKFIIDDAFRSNHYVLNILKCIAANYNEKECSFIGWLTSGNWWVPLGKWLCRLLIISSIKLWSGSTAKKKSQMAEMSTAMIRSTYDGDERGKECMQWSSAVMRSVAPMASGSDEIAALARQRRRRPTTDSGTWSLQMESISNINAASQWPTRPVSIAVMTFDGVDSQCESPQSTSPTAFPLQSFLCVCVPLRCTHFHALYL